MSLSYYWHAEYSDYAIADCCRPMLEDSNDVCCLPNLYGNNSFTPKGRNYVLKTVLENADKSICDQISWYANNAIE